MTSPAYLRLRRWVDQDLTSQRRPLAIFGPTFIVAVILMGVYGSGGVAILAGWAVITLFGAPWAAFVGWRAVRQVRAMTTKGDRDYDHRTKYLLAPEHQASESVLAARRRKRSLRP
ncbi:MAG: hypothetical protein EON90_03685 [Brevundimonas sp.]|nr:MAG: hypothetical protein EON90_03685 [Brevundimonas sp.]